MTWRRFYSFWPATRGGCSAGAISRFLATGEHSLPNLARAVWVWIFILEGTAGDHKGPPFLSSPPSPLRNRFRVEVTGGMYRNGKVSRRGYKHGLPDTSHDF